MFIYRAVTSTLQYDFPPTNSTRHQRAYSDESIELVSSPTAVTRTDAIFSEWQRRWFLFRYWFRSPFAALSRFFMPCIFSFSHERLRNFRHMSTLPHSTQLHNEAMMVICSFSSTVPPSYRTIWDQSSGSLPLPKYDETYHWHFSIQSISNSISVLLSSDSPSISFSSGFFSSNSMQMNLIHAAEASSSRYAVE